MTAVRLADDLVGQILAREPRYDERAYGFVLAAIEFLQTRLPVRRHLSGAELAHGVRELATEQFGLLAPAVLRFWGVNETVDLGRIVFTLVDVGLLVTQPGDRIEDFANAWDFESAFDAASYQWRGIQERGHSGLMGRGEVP
jgi:uncharacterized repeat protein (TIGR04138 family)